MTIDRFTAALVVLLAAGIAGLQGPALAGERAEEAIAGVVRGIWERPDAPIALAPLVLDGDHAVVGWTQAGRGGRALMRRAHSAWGVVFCSGEALRHADTLVRLGLAQAAAERLAATLRRAEAALPATRLALLDSFEGEVFMDAHGGYPAQTTPGSHR